LRQKCLNDFVCYEDYGRCVSSAELPSEEKCKTFDKTASCQPTGLSCAKEYSQKEICPGGQKCGISCTMPSTAITKPYRTGPVSSLRISQTEYENLLDKPCNSSKVDEIYYGYVTGNTICRLYCARSTEQVTQDKCYEDFLLQAKDELSCLEGKDTIIRKSTPGSTEYTEVSNCGYKKECTLGICSEVPLCRDGSCIPNTANCTSPNQVVPDIVPDKYIVCDPQSLTWEPLANSEPIAFDNCPNSWKNEFLSVINVVQDYIFPQGGVKIKCEGNGAGGGLSGNHDPQTELTVFCDPTQAKESCYATLVHEMAHTWEARRPHGAGENIFYNQDFNNTIGCQKEPSQQGVYAYTKEIAVDDDKYGPFLGYENGVGYSELNCAEAFALANNHYVYNGCYLKNNPKYKNTYDFMKNNIYKGEEFCEATPIVSASPTAKIFDFPFTQIPLVYSAENKSANSDLFDELESIQIFQKIDPKLLTKGKKVPNLNKDHPNREVYIFGSSSSSNTHSVYIEDGKVVFVQLVIPEDKQKEYTLQFLSLGGTILKLEKSETEHLVAFPDFGLAYIVEPVSQTVFEVQKFVPKSIDQFKKDEGKHYNPIDLTKLVIDKKIPVKSHPPFFIWILLATGTIALVFLAWWRWKKSNIQRNKLISSNTSL